MKNNKGFTMVELLAVFVIIGILSTIAIGSLSSILRSSKEKTYKELEDNLKVAAENYLLEHNDRIPDRGKTTILELASTLVPEGYSHPVADPDKEGSTCMGYVLITRGDVAGDPNMDLKYEVCLICSKYKTHPNCHM